ncbi:ATP-binding cassette domain-containing protein [Enterococcus pingfangensis]|uniref:ATP-binding cassette domain-containing protein n=1 Tax=Enterococcus pingfangensis TaxID=2559924 RepID=UPI001BB2A6C9|nr:ATP-binding cassette domain-containing protein [Enterococcus pingfangensis]
MAMIQTQQLTKMYGKQRGIQDVTLAIEAGEIFGFIGPNGAGKSTTIRLLLAMLFPTGGQRLFCKKS